MSNLNINVGPSSEARNLLFSSYSMLVLFAAASLLSACPHQKPCREDCVVFIGDSIISKWPTLQQAGQISGLQIINRGLPGDTTTHMRSRFNHDVVELCPRVVVILGGINDLAHNSLPVIENNLAQMAQIARQNNIQVVLAAIPPTGAPPSDHSIPAAASAQNQIRVLNTSLKSLAAQNHYTLLDAYSSLVDDRGYYRHGLTTDGVHLTADGYRLLDPLLRDAIAFAVRGAREPASSSRPSP